METAPRVAKGEWSSFGACEASPIMRKYSRLLGGASLFAPIYVSIWRGNKTAVRHKNESLTDSAPGESIRIPSPGYPSAGSRGS
jgi:hypothetical protein